jgi:hypothetical protein
MQGLTLKANLHFLAKKKTKKKPKNQKTLLLENADLMRTNTLFDKVVDHGLYCGRVF